MDYPGEREAPSSRDYLLPAPSDNFRGFKRKELKYQAAFGVESQIVSLVTCRGQKVFRANTGHYYTPHSGRNFMPTATAVLGFSKSDRDVLGGWSADGSERYSRAASFVFMQEIAGVNNDNDTDNDTLREVPHPSNEGLALQARVSGPWPHKESVLLVELARWQSAQVQTVKRQNVVQRYLK